MLFFSEKYVYNIYCSNLFKRKEFFSKILLHLDMYNHSLRSIKNKTYANKCNLKQYPMSFSYHQKFTIQQYWILYEQTVCWFQA